MTPAQREAYARANTSLIHLPALEFRHPTFGSPLRIVNYDGDISLPLEVGAPANSGATVLFAGVACDIKPPDIDDQVDAVTSVQIDGVSGIVQTLLANANDSNVPIDATLRFYSYNINTGVADGPVGVIHQQVRNIAVNKTSVAVSVGYTNSANASFPTQKYTSYSNPGLVS
jgi:Domain of unknown function (DUF1833)